MAMTSAQKKTLDRTLQVLSEDLDVTPAVIHLKSKDILTDIDEQTICAKVTKMEKVVELVRIIKTKGKTAFPVFTDYLENCPGSKHLAEELKENLKAVEAELAGLTLEKDGRRQIDIWKELEGKFYYSKCQHESLGQYRDIPEELNVLLIGKTGSGKSSTGNTIIGQSYFEEGDTSESTTKTIKMKRVKENRFNITVIDTPGLFDTAKNLRNKDTLLEIAKTMINFNGGVHLFLLVCNSTRYTEEEQKTVAVIEQILSKDIYKYCLVVMTSASARYDAKGEHTLQKHIDKELKAQSNFSRLINRVEKRVVAVENSFKYDFLREKHRQSLLCHLAQVIQDNKGSVYSNKAFKYARERAEEQDEERNRRIQREKDLTTMRSQIRKFMVQKHLNDMTVEQLENIHSLLETDQLSLIMTNSFVSQLNCIKEEDAKEYLNEFIEENGVLIKVFKDKRIQEEEQFKENQRRQQQLEEKKARHEMQHIALGFVNGYLKELSTEELQEIIRKRTLPIKVMNTLQERLDSSNLKVDGRHVHEYIQEIIIQTGTRLMNETILKETLREKERQLKELQRSLEINVTMKLLKTKLPEALNDKTDDELVELRENLKNFETSGGTRWEQLFAELIGSEIANNHITLGEISEFLKQNAKLFESIMSSILEKRQKQMEAKERQEREELRNNTLSKISEVIKNNLESHLTGMNTDELQKLEADISREEVPYDIFEEVCGELTRAQMESLTRKEIEKEIISQIKSQNEIIKRCKEEAQKCFSGSSKVVIKGRGISQISNVKIDDEILVFDKDGVCFFDKVYLISHAKDEENFTFLRVKTFFGKELFLSPGHLIPVGSLFRNVAANELAIGDVIFTLQNGIMTSDSVTWISYKLCRGSYCPITMNGTIVVNDVAASCYTTFIPARVAHLLLSPIRLLFRYLPLSLFDKLLPYDDAEGMPVLLLKCRSIVIAWRSLVDSFSV